MANNVALTLLEIYRSILRGDLYFTYNGHFNDDLTGHITNVLSSQFNEVTTLDKKHLKRTNYIVLEAFQNIIRYQLKDPIAQDDKTVNFECIQLFIKGDSIFISSMNKVETNTSINLRSVLEELKALSKEELKLRWKNQLADGVLTEGGGGGLGLIEMARKTDAPLDFKFWKISDNRALFRLNLKLGELTEKEVNQGFENTLDDLAFDQISEEAIVGIKGVLQAQTLNDLLSFLSAFFKHEKNQSSKEIETAKVLLDSYLSFGESEMDGKKGYFILGREERGYYYLCGYQLAKANTNKTFMDEKSSLTLQESCASFDHVFSFDKKEREFVNIVCTTS